MEFQYSSPLHSPARKTKVSNENCKIGVTYKGHREER